MAFFDLPRTELEHYLPPRAEPEDFDAFWAATLAEVRTFPLHAVFEPVDIPLQTVEVFDVTYAGFGGQPIRGWLVLPKDLPRPLPCIVEFVGYGGGRGFPFDRLIYVAAGFAHFIMDTRGQGNGQTADVEPPGSNPQYPGFLTRGILRPETYYYRRVFTDAVRAVEAAGSHPAIDGDRLIITGSSQGGGISLAVSGLEPRVKAIMPDVPFLCHYRRATEIVDTSAYSEISLYLKIHRDHIATVFRTLSYFDGINFAVRATAPALFSVGLMDTTCPPSTVYAAYNHYAGPKQIRVYDYNRHEGGEGFHTQEKLRFLMDWR